MQQPQFNTDKKTPPVNLGILRKPFVPYRNSEISPIVLNSRGSRNWNVVGSNSSQTAQLPALLDQPYLDPQKHEKDKKMSSTFDSDRKEVPP
jgi:hypothetical protein